MLAVKLGNRAVVKAVAERVACNQSVVECLWR